MARIAYVIVSVMVLGGLVPSAVTAAPPLDVVLVQYQVEAEDYSSLDRFQDRIAEIVAGAVAESQPDLIVFPEYTSVFALFADVIAAEGSLQLEEIPPEVVAMVASNSDAEESQRVVSAGGAHRFVLQRAHRFGARIIDIWSSVAEEHGVWIVAGTGFVPAPEGGLNNRMWVFDRTGSIVYHQDKVYLTPFERVNLGVVPGAVSEADTFVVEGIELAVTICRDSYFDAWEREFSAVDAWIDVRANGEKYSPAVRRRFDTALPERVAETPVRMGLSTSLNGRFLELLWQGPAFVVDEDGVRTVQAPTVDGDYLMEVVVPDAIPERAVSERNSVD